MIITISVDFQNVEVNTTATNALTFGESTGGGSAVVSVNGKTGVVVLTTTDIAEGTNQYFTAARVLASVLSGLSTATNAVITASDTVLSAFGKLQAQITALSSSLSGYVTLATDQTISGLKTYSREIVLSAIATPSYLKGKLFYDNANDCLSYMDADSQGTLQIAYQQFARARNNTGSIINKGSVVYISGAVGQELTMALARADNITTSMILGVAYHDIAVNAIGKIVINGLMRDFNTGSFTDGQEVYLSAATAGLLTATPPGSPNFVVKIGTIEYANNVNGKMYVNTFQPLANNNSLGTAQNVGATQNAVKSYVDTGLGAKQNSLGFTPENVANKSTTTTLGTSNTLYPTQNAVKTYVDALAAKNLDIDLWVGSSTTTNTAETILRTITVTGNTISNSDFLWLTAQISTSQTSGTFTSRFRCGTDAVPVDITLQTFLISGGGTANAGGYNVGFHNYISVTGGNFIGSTLNIFANTAGSQQTTITAPNLANTWYIYVTSQKSVAGGTINLTSVKINRQRL